MSLSLADRCQILFGSSHLLTLDSQTMLGCALKNVADFQSCYAIRTQMVEVQKSSSGLKNYQTLCSTLLLAETC